VPARVLARTDVGMLTVGGAADIVVLDDSLELRTVVVGGRAL
jgi:N-acetylglucosamine-6-phosphate deacetylase